MFHFLKRTPIPSGPVLINTIAKSGTHLAAKYFSLAGLTFKGGFDAGIGHRVWSDPHASLFSPNAMLKEKNTEEVYFGSTWLSECKKNVIRDQFPTSTNEFAATHMLYSEAMDELIRKANLSMVIILRHPLSVALSTTAWIMSSDNGKLSEYYQTLSADEREFCSVFGSDTAGILPLKLRYQNMLHWLRKPYAHHTSFEDLVGPKGGGTIEAQQKAAEKLSAFLPNTNDNATWINQLFGGTQTFHTGQIKPHTLPAVYASSEVKKEIEAIENLPVLSGYYGGSKFRSRIARLKLWF